MEVLYILNIIIIQIISIILTLIFGVIICVETKKELDETREKLKISNETSKNYLPNTFDTSSKFRIFILQRIRKRKYKKYR